MNIIIDSRGPLYVVLNGFKILGKFKTWNEIPLGILFQSLPKAKFPSYQEFMKKWTFTKENSK